VPQERHVPLVVVVGLRGRDLDSAAFERQRPGLHAQRKHRRTVHAVHHQAVRLTGLKPQYQVDRIVRRGRVRPFDVAPAARLERHEIGNLKIRTPKSLDCTTPFSDRSEISHITCTFSGHPEMMP